MSTERDELAAGIAEARWPDMSWAQVVAMSDPEPFRVEADALIAAGWRKMPSVTEIEFALYERMGGTVDLGYPFMPDVDKHLEAASLADAVLALMEGSDG